MSAAEVIVMDNGCRRCLGNFRTVPFRVYLHAEPNAYDEESQAYFYYLFVKKCRISVFTLNLIKIWDLWEAGLSIT
jgi:hypothetical protein